LDESERRAAADALASLLTSVRARGAAKCSPTPWARLKTTLVVVTPCFRCRSAELPPGPAVGTPIPVSISKDGEDPVIQEDSAYPEWLFQIGATEQETTEEMLSRGLKNLSYTEGRQLFRMLRRDKIKASNKANRKIG